MREATIGGLSALDEIRPRKAAGPATPKAKASRARTREGRMARFRRFKARATFIIGSAGFSAIMIGIVLNATVMQKGHHPAPLFTGAAPQQAPVAAPTVDPAPPPAAPAAVAMPAPVPQEAAAAPQSVPPPLPLAHHATAPLHATKADDPIARLLGGAIPRSTTKKPAHPVRPVAKATLPASSHPKATGAAGKPKAVPLASIKPAAPAAVN